MDKKQIIAIAVVAVLLVTAVAATIILTKDDGEKPVVVTNRLVVYGNANNDDYLDDRDVSFIQKIIDGKETWDKDKNPFADTDTNGKITSDDITLLKKFINKEKATMYYYDFMGTVQSVHFPITGNLAVLYNYGLDATMILGCYDRVTGATNQTINSVKSNTEDRYPGLSKMINCGKPQDDPQELLDAEKKGIVAFFGVAETYTVTIQNKMKEAGSNMDIISLNMSGTRGYSCDYLGGLLTLGYMLGCEDNAHKYLDFVDSTMEKLNGYLKNAPVKKAVVVQPLTNTATCTVRTTTAAGSCMGNYYTFMMLPLDDPFKNQYEAYRVDVNIEDLDTKYNPDVVIVTDWAVLTQSMTRDEGQEMCDDYAQYIPTLTAYKNKDVYSTSFECYGTFSGPAALPLLASYIWPDLVDQKWAKSVLQDYFDQFSTVKVDVDKSALYAPFQMS